MVGEVEAILEDQRDVRVLVAEFFVFEEAPGGEPEREVGGRGHLAAELGVQAGEDRERLLVEELEIEGRQVVFEEADILPREQAEGCGGILQQREVERSGLGAEVLRDVVRLGVPGDGIRRRRRAGGHGAWIPGNPWIASHHERAERDQDRLARLGFGEIVDLVDEFHDFRDRLHRLHDRGILRRPEERAGDIEERRLLGPELLEEHDLLGEDLRQRLDRLGDLVDLVEDRGDESGQEFAEVELHVFERDDRRPTERNLRHPTAEGGAREHLVVVDDRADPGERERLLVAPHRTGTELERGSEIDIGFGRQRRDDRKPVALQERPTIPTAALHVDAELAVEPARPAIEDVRERSLQEDHVGRQRRPRRHGRGEVEPQFIARRRHATGVEIEAIDGAQADAEAEDVVEAKIDRVVGPGADVEPGDGRREIDRNRDDDVFCRGGILVVPLEDTGPRREHLLEEAVAERDVELEARAIDPDLDLVLVRDRDELLGTGERVVYRQPLGVEEGNFEDVQARLAELLVERGPDAVEEEIRDQQVVVGIGVVVLGDRVGELVTEASGVVPGERFHGQATVQHAEEIVAEPVDELRRILELVADHRQGQRGELGIEPALDPREHPVEAPEHHLRIVEDREDVLGDLQEADLRADHPDVVLVVAAEEAIDVEGVIGDPVEVAIAVKSSQRRAGGGEVEGEVGAERSHEVNVPEPLVGRQFRDVVLVIDAVLGE